MNRRQGIHDEALVTGDRLSRRALFKGTVATVFGAAAGAVPMLAAFSARAATPAMEWQSFDRDVQAAMSTFGMVGAAVAVVTGAGVLHQQTFGVRNRASGAPVTKDTLFRVGSATKSMTLLLVGAFVDEGLLDWDQPVVKVWPAFRAPTPALTESLRVRDLMGMDSGLGEGPLAFHYDAFTSIQLMQALAVVQVRTAPFTEWYYNNVVYSSGGLSAVPRQRSARRQIVSGLCAGGAGARLRADWHGRRSHRQ